MKFYCSNVDQPRDPKQGLFFFPLYSHASQNRFQQNLFFSGPVSVKMETYFPRLWFSWNKHHISPRTQIIHASLNRPQLEFRICSQSDTCSERGEIAFLLCEIDKEKVMFSFPHKSGLSPLLLSVTLIWRLLCWNPLELPFVGQSH